MKSRNARKAAEAAAAAARQQADAATAMVAEVRRIADLQTPPPLTAEWSDNRKVRLRNTTRQPIRINAVANDGAFARELFRTPQDIAAGASFTFDAVSSHAKPWPGELLLTLADHADPLCVVLPPVDGDHRPISYDPSTRVSPVWVNDSRRRGWVS